MIYVEFKMEIQTTSPNFNALSDLFHLYGDVIPLQFARLEPDIFLKLQNFADSWVQYNSSKPDILRKGLSVTSLDGGLSGYPDLDSVREYNLKNNVFLREADFHVRTKVAEVSLSIQNILNAFNPIGRTHFIKLDAGGFFPPHRDGGTKIPAASFRIFATVHNATEDEFVWLQDGKQLLLESRRFYAINTFKKHSVYSFSDDCVILVFNIPVSKQNIQTVLENMLVK